ncbi:uncharacterized protein PAC_01791 [Phialocephala subalpina]|uniref:Uncharacterized protein n=1 Tax=Phialocephala subalpina TaxID=576137 RepID=A0A1L7WGL7_9HELO|nr:uncharacterized protein PAC_01791 [Phialocephala subalpina]
MPSEHLPSQSQTRPALSHRSTSDIDSPHGTPPQHGRTKTAKHVVGGRTHARVPSSKGLHKLTKGHGNEGSHTDLKKLGKQSSSSTNLKKNSSHVSLKRNRSSVDVQKRPRSAQGHEKRPASVHFEIGDQEDVWEEASTGTSASPALSRSAFRSAVSSGQPSAKSSANNSQPQSPPHSPLPTKIPAATTNANGSNEKQNSRTSADAKVITERLLQRNPSHHNTTKMSLTTATPAGHSPESLAKSQSSTLNGTPQTGSNNEVVSRFVGGSGTPSENSPFLHNRQRSDPPKAAVDEVKRAQSMGNLTRRDSDEESALAPRSRKSSQSSNYYPPQQSRTQQKLWLQRASSNIEPAQMAPGVALNGIHGGYGGTSLVGGAGYDGRDPRVKLQLEKTGLEYLVVRRYQDPVGKSLKRLNQLPGAEKNRRIPPQRTESSGVNRYGLSQSLQSRRGGKDKSSPANGAGSYDGQSGSLNDAGISDRANDDDGVGAILQAMWQKSFDLSASAD